METLPSKNRSPSEEGRIVAALTIVCGLVCQRRLDEVEIAYVYSRLQGIRSDVLIQAIEKLGDTSERVGNPIAAIREVASTIVRDERETRESRLRAEEGDHLPMEVKQRYRMELEAKLARPK